jgi:hypothetical protein
MVEDKMSGVAEVPAWAKRRMAEGEAVLFQLLNCHGVAFNEHLRGRLPESHGIYAIYAKNAAPGDVLRAGRTKTAAGGLRQRIYQNHFQGDQQGNLRSQLVQQCVCKSMEETKPWIRANCLVQYAVIENDAMRMWAENLMLAVLRPKYCG